MNRSLLDTILVSGLTNRGETGMRACEGHIGRVFMLRLDDGDMIPSCIERFAEDKNIRTGQVVLVGGIGGGDVVAGPRDSVTMPPEPMLVPLDGAHEVVGVGVIAPGQDGKPVLHIHAALGRAGHAVAGCLRPGVVTWLVGEAIIYELTGIRAERNPDSKSGFTLLEI